MAKIDDIGEHIPGAHKERLRKKVPLKKYALKTVWPEPDWEVDFDHLESSQISTIYCLYHTLAKYPKKHGSINNVKNKKSTIVSQEEWEQAWFETIGFIRHYIEEVKSFCIDKLKDELNNQFEESRFHYAAGWVCKSGYFKRPTTFRRRERELARLLPLLGFPKDVKAKKIRVAPVECVDERYRIFSFDDRQKNGVSLYETDELYENSFSSYEEAASAINKYHSKEFRPSLLKLPKPLEPYNPKKNHSLVKSSVNCKNVSAQEFMSEFGFRGVQFGNSLSEKYKQNAIANSFVALTELATILEIPHEKIARGRLGFAFASRGIPFSSAHYESKHEVINLTKKTGMGSIAHEMFHAIDAMLCNRLTGDPGLLSCSYTMHRPGTPELKFFSEFRNLVCQESDTLSRVEELDMYGKNRQYWSTSPEMMARAFEAWVQDKLINNQIDAEWLAYGTLAEDYQKMVCPYPVDEERELSNTLFDEKMPILMDFLELP